MVQRLQKQDRSMHFRLPGPQLRLCTLIVLIAVLEVSLWAGLSIWSPTRRMGRLLQADQPTFIRREAASSLGRGIPSWEVGQAVSLLISALDDPSPRVREYVGVSLAERGPRAGRAIPKLLTVLNDEDRFVRCSAAATLGFIVTARSAERDEAVAALARVLDDKDPNVRLAAAGALVKLGEAQKAAGVLVAAYVGTGSFFRDWARSIMRDASDPRPFIAPLARELRDRGPRRRDEVLQTLQTIASPKP
jgi:HEAT repeats